ncbi:MAG: hypothetical protein GW772_08185 [Flavobacteriia bacterium]|nr:hypothetical protein [Flavobacteriia bacterium]OIP47048.1 MAG: hypothetical protein AUK46_06520 [Flavobacteriaceae bacterium CG2_30_31_66]PIV97779.1 MAG: hypothetical protein COW43_01270 [Flavobacteriaceae bacterium CG17_big_fil_post_rev_8_21_14_2_50_31_13]PIX12785.1 MAG: hypothetical protein COZ74_09680 [Flavobacteriaceae bacterium CG_4_8_14_3_um_filter_31_8]PIY14516.1 MAG: hypothetical protein COZ16_08735 [Flavobacteriaceae bacterium CG_4_10_14_3_um_filter_31_253]PIZ11890.1 MAG: hypotheti
MSFLKKLQQRKFWSSFFKIAIPFFIIVTIFSLALNSWSDIFAGDFAKVAETNFNNGKWQVFFGYKIVLSFFYGLYVTNKNMKS